MYMYTFKLEIGNSGIHQKVSIVTERIKNDTNGNPIYLVSVFMVNKEGTGHQWSPEGLGIKRKDGKLRMQSFEGHQKVANQVFDKLQIVYMEESV